MTRRNGSNPAIQELLSGPYGHGWTTDVPLGFQARVMPGVTPARESAGGRGAVFFDVFKGEGAGYGRALSLKIDDGTKKGLGSFGTVTLTVGTFAHCQAVINAAESGRPLPVLVLVRIVDGWAWAAFDVSDILALNGIDRPHEGQGKGRGCGKAGVLMGTKVQRSKAGKIYEYVSLSVNLKGNGIEWGKISTLDGFDWAQHSAAYWY